MKKQSKEAINQARDFSAQSFAAQIQARLQDQAWDQAMAQSVLAQVKESERAGLWARLVLRLRDFSLIKDRQNQYIEHTSSFKMVRNHTGSALAQRLADWKKKFIYSNLWLTMTAGTAAAGIFIGVIFFTSEEKPVRKSAKSEYSYTHFVRNQVLGVYNDVFSQPSYANIIQEQSASAKTAPQAGQAKQNTTVDSILFSDTDELITAALYMR